MCVNYITGYDINRDECGERRDTSSRISVSDVTLSLDRTKQDLFDESEKEWLYSKQLRKNFK